MGLFQNTFLFFSSLRYIYTYVCALFYFYSGEGEGRVKGREKALRSMERRGESVDRRSIHTTNCRRSKLLLSFKISKKITKTHERNMYADTSCYFSQ